MNPVYLIYDIGKTNKKVLVFSVDGQVLDEYAEQFPESIDEDGFPCDDIDKLTDWVLGQYEQLSGNPNYQILGINFATYGASFVHIDAQGKLLTPLYNYLKPVPASMQETFLQQYFGGNADEFALNTASPMMGMLNSGLQLYWLKQAHAQTWKNIQYSLHLPQYLSWLFTRKALSDYTSIGCHTGLWNVNNKLYHPWVFAEGVEQKLAPTTDSAIAGYKDSIVIGVGLHDSSSALIPYLQQYQEPFLLISTGTWCINLNPFNEDPLTPEELKKDCLCYLKADGKPVKASRIFLGKEHEFQVDRIAWHFGVAADFYKQIHEPVYTSVHAFIPACMEGSGPMPQKQTMLWDLQPYKSAAAAYTALMQGLTDLLVLSIDLVNMPTIKYFFIDGGFAANALFKHCLQQHYPNQQIATVGFSQATALGAFLHLKQNQIKTGF
jgi:sugar (pentulose or hexulose) kinase